MGSNEVYKKWKIVARERHENDKGLRRKWTVPIDM